MGSPLQETELPTDCTSGGNSTESPCVTMSYTHIGRSVLTPCPQPVSASGANPERGDIARRSPRTIPRLGPYSKALDRGSCGWSIDGRSKEGRFLRAYERMLAEHLGGKPSRVQVELIRRCARLALHLELQDEKSLSDAGMSDHTARQYLAWHGALVRTLCQLGVRGSPERAPTLAEIMASSSALPRPRRAPADAGPISGADVPTAAGTLSTAPPLTTARRDASGGSLW
jgi:hypothetical protein